MRFTALLHHVYHIDALRMAYFHLKHEAAPGVDGETWRHYGQALEEHLQDLSARLKRGTYRAKPVRRAYIARTDGRMLRWRDDWKMLVQRAVVEVMNAIYETDFVNFSYGFRPGRSQHDALDALYAGLLTRKVNGVLDLDIRGFFDAIEHGWLVKSSSTASRIDASCDSSGNATPGVEAGQRRYVDRVPQGGSASPLLRTSICTTCLPVGSSVAAQARPAMSSSCGMPYIVAGFQVKWMPSGSGPSLSSGWASCRRSPEKRDGWRP